MLSFIYHTRDMVVTTKNTQNPFIKSIAAHATKAEMKTVKALVQSPIYVRGQQVSLKNTSCPHGGKSSGRI
jgi:hypothetical protein